MWSPPFLLTFLLIPSYLLPASPMPFLPRPCQKCQEQNTILNKKIRMPNGDDKRKWQEDTTEQHDRRQWQRKITEERQNETTEEHDTTTMAEQIVTLIVKCKLTYRMPNEDYKSTWQENNTRNGRTKWQNKCKWQIQNAKWRSQKRTAEEHDRSKRHKMMTLVDDSKYGRRDSDIIQWQNTMTEYDR